MAFSYSPGSREESDELRRLVGDTQRVRHLLDDAAIQRLIEDYGSARSAAVAAIDEMLATARSLPDQWSSGAESETSGRVRQLEQLRASLLDRGLPAPADSGDAGSSVLRTLTRCVDDSTEYVQ